MAVVPGLERVGDLVAVLRRTDQSGKEVFLITEIEGEPRRHAVKRLGVYTLLLSIEESTGPGPEDEPPVGSCLLNLTGRREPATVKLQVPGTTSQLTVGPLVVNLGSEDAARTLAAVREGTTARCILPWIPLMAGGGDRGLIEDWKKVAGEEPDAELRSAYGLIALVFAELTATFVSWQQALEGWEMKESQVLSKIKREGAIEAEIRTLRGAVLEVLRVRLANPVPEAVRLAVEGTNDPEILRRWHHLALTTNTIREFGGAIAAPE